MENIEERQLYALYILRKDSNHINVLESTDYDKVYKTWEELSSKWENSVKENKPFSLTSPIVTCFNPNIIYEITIRVIDGSISENTNNPYKKRMAREGFSSTFGNYTSPIKDGGYL